MVLFVAEKPLKPYKDGRIGTAIEAHASMRHARQAANKIGGIIVTYANHNAERYILQKIDDGKTPACLPGNSHRVLYDADEFMAGYGAWMDRNDSKYKDK